MIFVLVKIHEERIHPVSVQTRVSTFVLKKNVILKMNFFSLWVKGLGTNNIKSLKNYFIVVGHMIT